MMVSVPPGAENGALALLDLIRNADAYEAKIKEFAETRAQLEAMQRQIAEAGVQVSKQASANDEATRKIVDMQARIDIANADATKRLAIAAKADADLQKAEAVFDAKVKETGDALAARERATAAKEAELADREAVLADREVKVDELTVELERMKAKLRAAVG